jgi:hypothetical protein
LEATRVSLFKHTFRDLMQAAGVAIDCLTMGGYGSKLRIGDRAYDHLGECSHRYREVGNLQQD